MALKIQKPKVHDNTDGDVIIINKSKLSYHLYLIKNFYFSSGTSLGFLGLSVAFGANAFIAENFRSFGIQGETWRAVFILLAATFFGFFVYTGQIWLRLRKKHDPDLLVNSLLNEEPQELKGIQFTDSDRK